MRVGRFGFSSGFGRVNRVDRFGLDSGFDRVDRLCLASGFGLKLVQGCAVVVDWLGLGRFELVEWMESGLGLVGGWVRCG